jgi:3-oxoacyl-[acyl-carrier protein] reductase
MDLGLKDKRAVITGGTKGIGRRCAGIFADEGSHVSICARNAGEIEETVTALRAKGVTAHGMALDVSDKAALEAWVNDAASVLGGIDIVVPNVSALDMADTEEAWRHEFEIDMLHTVRTVNAAMSYLEQSSAPAIVVVSSVSGREVDFTSPAYGAMKAALIHYAQGLAYKLAGKMIRVNSVSPGNTYFDGGIWQWVENNNPELFKQALALNPTGRMATAEEVARGVVFLASSASSFTTGTNLVIDGALTKGVQF